MNRNEAIAYLTRCADDNGNHWYQGRIWAMSNCPNDISSCPICHGTNHHDALVDSSRYGRWSSECAEVAYRHAVWFARETGQELTREDLDSSMSSAVNDHADVETDLQGYAAELAGANVDDMVSGYLDAQLWAGLDYDHTRCDDCNPGDEPHPWDMNYSRDAFSDEYVDTVRAELAALVYAHPLAVRMYLAQRRYDAGQGSVSSYFGHDFYLTREGHGAGFWDRGLGDLGDYLTQVSKWSGPAADVSDRGDGELR